tara:strand:- start:16565 stop:18469 length:1905 start_codon:yes stop_codon:yes gene_type:complete
MGDSESVGDFPDSKQRYAVCNSLFDKSTKASIGIMASECNMGYSAESCKADTGGSCSCVAAEPMPKGGETHEEYMSRCMAMGYSEEECMKAHEGHEFEVEGYHDDEKKKYASEKGDCGCGCKGGTVSYENWEEEGVTAAEYQGRKVTLNKPFRTPGENKKFGVYTKNGSGTVVIVRFGDPNMEIKRDDPERRKSFRSRHNCDSPGPKWKARYWSCRQWRSGPKVEAGTTPCGCVEEVPQKANENTCASDEELIDGVCQKVAVTIDLEIGDVEAIVEASTGNQIVKISGIAFHEGINKNNWELTREAAVEVAEQMVGADITLNHPEASEYGSGFSRNMDGGVNEAVVGYIASTFVEDLPDGKWNVRYIAHVVRSELFASLESGLWSREDYGVSIGGSGVPIEATEERVLFGPGFSFDHLAIVHKPAYPRANIEEVERINASDNSTPERLGSARTFIYQPNGGENITQQVYAMTDETTVDYEADMATMKEEMEAMQASLVLANSRVNEYVAEEEARVEASRIALVEEATGLGMSGHEELSSDTLTDLIASWNAAHPDPEPVEMKPVEEAVASETEVIASEEPRTVVANYLNGEMVESDEDIYSRAWNAWAKAWNQTLAHDEKTMRAPRYEDIKEMI